MVPARRYAVPPAPRDPSAARFRGGRTIAAPPQIVDALAVEGYAPWLSSAAIEPLQVAWSEERRAVLEQVFNEVRARFVWIPDGPIDKWRRLARRLRGMGRSFVKFYAGDCDDFALEILYRLVNHPSGLFPRGCLRLAACKVRGQDHLVLTIETDCGSLVLCNLAGMKWKSARALIGYAWLCRERLTAEAESEAWEELEPPTLEDLARRHSAGA
ncbi:MAG TPA: hypothetical protein EYP07_05695 [Kiloniellaceae bacterium]|nr:hypothetical protein [Kiloniellaceae bacterium]